jgi:hypothetical protein
MHAHLRVIAIPVADADTLGRLDSAVLDELEPPLNLNKVARTHVRRRLTELHRQYGGRGVPKVQRYSSQYGGRWVPKVQRYSSRECQTYVHPEARSGWRESGAPHERPDERRLPRGSSRGESGGVELRARQRASWW